MDRKGFSLLELIIVIIIVGVLSALALPRYFKMIEVARTPEAIVNLKLIREIFERCYLMSGQFIGCDWESSADNPNSQPNRHFDYSVGIAESSGPLGQHVATIYATRNSYELGSGDDVCMIESPTCGSYEMPGSTIVLCHYDNMDVPAEIIGCGFYANLH